MRPSGALWLRSLRSGSIAVAVLLFVAAQSAGAADATATSAVKPVTRPRIGLVLGGGGAKGAAHIGVIKVLEEMRIPIDCIAGTSMGSIVGAAYATGISSQQLEQIITAVNWKDILASAPRQEIPVHRKELDFIFTNGLELGVKDGGIVTPSGLVPTHQIEALFRRIVAGAGQVTSFDQLPIPFRAVATDLESGQMKVFDRGDLAMAMRASMAVPAAFAPVDYQGHLYVDGMLVRNVPVDVARKMCGDVVIAVPVSNPALTRKNLTTFIGVAGQAMNIAIEANEKAQLATLTDKDVEVPVILQDIGSSDFAKVPEAIPIGEAAARKMAESLSRYSLSPQEYAQWRAHLRTVAERPAERIDQVRIAGLKVTNPEVVQTFVRTQPGDTFDAKKADADTTAIVARGDYTVASYGLDTEDGSNVLTYTAVEKPWGPNYLLFDLNLNTDLHGDTGWGIRLDMENRWLNSLGGELRTTFQLGRPNAFGAEFYQPLDARQRFFVAPSVFAWQTVSYLYDNGQRVIQFDSRRYGMRMDGGMALDSWGEVRAGLLRGSANARTLIGPPELPESGWAQLGAATLRFVVDTYDLRLFPTSGTYAQVNGYFSTTGLGADQTYQTMDARWSKVLTWDRDVLTFSLRGGTNFSSSVPFYDQFKEGGLFNFSGYRANELIGREFAFGSVQYRRRLGYLQETLGTAAWGGGTLEAGNVYQRLDGVPSQGLLFGGSLFVGVNSKLGPVYFGYGLSQGGHSSFYLMIGSSLDVF